VTLPRSVVLSIRHIGMLRFWIVVFLMALISVAYYDQSLHTPFITGLMDELGLDRHAFERILYLVPIIVAGFLFGHKGAFSTTLIALVCMLPRDIFISSSAGDALFETGAVFCVGSIISITFRSLHLERKRSRQLTALNQISLVGSQSLELDPILDSSIKSIVDVMRVDAALVFLVYDEEGALELVAHRGVSEQFAQGVVRLKPGEGLNGEVVQRGEPLYVNNASIDPRLTRTILIDEDLKSMLIVPLKSKEKVLGTLSVAMRTYRKFQTDEVELLCAIGNQVGLAIENARLYQQEREFIEQLRVSEERYRELFENAHDAIWLYDLEKNIIAANRSFVRLTGYSMEELQSMKVVDLLSEEFVVNASDVENPSYNGEGTGQLSEVILVKKDGSEAYVQLSTNPIFDEGLLVAFQHIARDITEEKRMRENQRFYVQQVTKAQEEERKRIARELHDDTTQELIVLSRELDNLFSKSISLSEGEKLQLHKLWQQTDSIIAGIKRLSQDLRPSALDRLGLLPALEWLASNVEEHSGITVEFISHGDEHQLDHESELVLFRIAQEALNNVWRHSGASTARIIVEFHNSGTKITIEDNGQGFRIPAGMGDLAKEGKLGLAGMQERARLLDATVSVQSKLGKGTVVTVESPI